MRSAKAVDTIDIHGKTCRVHVSKRAQEALQRRKQPLYVQMELYFSCLLRLQVRFTDVPPAGVNIPLDDGVYLSFRPIMTAQCSNDGLADAPPVTDFPIVSDSPFIPHWLEIDYRHGQWYGEFGYATRT